MAVGESANYQKILEKVQDEDGVAYKEQTETVQPVDSKEQCVVAGSSREDKVDHVQNIPLQQTVSKIGNQIHIQLPSVNQPSVQQHWSCQSSEPRG